MLPILFDESTWQLRSYDVLLCLSATISMLVVLRDAKKEGYNVFRFFILLICVLIFALFGARINGWLFWFRGDFALLKEHILSHKSGMTAFGGLIGAILSTCFFSYLNRWKVVAILDLLIPVLALGESIQRIGCFLNGCCYGRPNTNTLGFFLPDSIGIWAYRYPSQIITGLFCALLFFWLKRQRKTAPFDGYLTLQYLLLYNVGRLFLDFLRGDEPIALGVLSSHQLTGALIAISSCFILFFVMKFQRRISLK